MRLPFGQRTSLSKETAKAVGLGRGERILGAAATADGAHVVITTFRFVVVSGENVVTLARPWHEVDGGAWDQNTETLRVTWVDEPETRFALAGDRDFHGAFRERVQASVVSEEFVDFGGGRRARAAIRKNLATGELSEQVIVGKGVSFDQPGVRAECEATLRRLREEIGLD